MDVEYTQEDWENVFPTHCPLCQSVLIWYLWDAVCPICDLDRQPDGDPPIDSIERSIDPEVR